MRALPSLSEVTRNQPYIFVTHLPGVARISQARAQLGCERMPVCGLLHSALLPDLIPSFIWLCLSLEPADMLVATSRAGRLTLERLLQSGAERIAQSTGRAPKLPKGCITQIPFGVNLPAVEIDRRGARSVLGIPQDCFTILYLGRITEEFKADLDPLIDAAARMAAGGRRVQLVLAGQHQDPVYSRHVRNRLEQLKLADKTLLLDNFPEFLKSTIYAACDVFVSPADSVQETFGLSVLEAMAYARPVIAASWSGYRDLVVPGETGFLISTKWSPDAARFASASACFADIHELSHYLAQRTVLDAGELAEGLEQLADAPEMARRMGDAGRARVMEHFTWQHVAARFVELWGGQIESAAAQRPRTAAKPVEFDRFFGHYADAVMSPGDFLVPVDPGSDADLAEHWNFFEASQQRQAAAILAACRRGPVRLSDLYARGFSSDCVLWLAKKGLCMIQSPDPLSNVGEVA